MVTIELLLYCEMDASSRLWIMPNLLVKAYTTTDVATYLAMHLKVKLVTT